MCVCVLITPVASENYSIEMKKRCPLRQVLLLRRKLSQLRTNKSPLLMTYLHKIDPANHPAANCQLCNDPNHDSLHLFNCPDIPTTLTVWDLWTDPVGVAALLDVWGEKLGGPRAGSEILCVLTHGMGSTPPPPQVYLQSKITHYFCGPQVHFISVRRRL